MAVLTNLAGILRIDGTLESSVAKCTTELRASNKVSELVLEAQYATLAVARDKEDREFERAIRARRLCRVVSD